MSLAEQLLWSAPGAALLALAYAYWRSRTVGAAEAGTDRMRDVALWGERALMALRREGRAVVVRLRRKADGQIEKKPLLILC